MPPLGTPLADLKITFNTAGVAGLFGGEEAISAMATVHLFKGRRWLGWYNSPASYSIAKRFGRVGNSRFWQGFFPGPRDSLDVLLGLDGKQGPRYISALSETEFNTQHIGYLAMEGSKEVEVTEMMGRLTIPHEVAYLAMRPVARRVPIQPLPLGRRAFYALIAIFSSVVTCVMCALVYDWFSFSTILIGIISGGLATSVIGKGRLVIDSVVRPALPGHGILISEHGIMVIKGDEGDVNTITKGRFNLMTRIPSARSDDFICVCSLILFLQSLFQLLLISQGTLFGQIMFIISVGVSWWYNSYLSSLEKEKIQSELLFQALRNPQMLRFRLGTRTMMAVFVCLLLFHGVECAETEEKKADECAHRDRILQHFLPNDTRVWWRWREKVVKQLVEIDDGSDSLPHLVPDMDDSTLSELDKKLLNMLLDDARAAFSGYFRIRSELPDDSSHQKEG